MKKRKLGKTGMEISPLVFGGNVFGWTVDQAASFKLLDAFVAAGFNSVDTADVYSKWMPGHTGGESEMILGEWMKRSGNRNKVIVATKVGMDMGDGKKGLSKSHILRSAEDSLRRLQTDCIDLYQSHIDDPDTPMEETLGAYAELIKQGKVRAIGASNHKAERLAAALETSKKCGLPAYQTLQPNFSLIELNRFVNRKDSASSIIFLWPADFSPANTVRKAMRRGRLGHATSQSISTNEASGFSARSTKSRRNTTPRPPGFLSLGCWRAPALRRPL